MRGKNLEERKMMVIHHQSETWDVESIHVMLATGIKRDADEILIQCKNTYRR